MNESESKQGDTIVTARGLYLEHGGVGTGTTATKGVHRLSSKVGRVLIWQRKSHTTVLIVFRAHALKITIMLRLGRIEFSMRTTARTNLIHFSKRRNPNRKMGFD
jgi:hypothetical protein